MTLDLKALARVGHSLVLDAAHAYHWYMASVRPATPPRWPMSLCNRVLRDAHHQGLSDFREERHYAALVESDAREAQETTLQEIQNECPEDTVG